MDIVRVEAGVRYPEDALVNGMFDDNECPMMPFLTTDPECTSEWRWSVDIEVATGRIVGWAENHPHIEARVSYKVCDCCRIKWDGRESEDYVPSFLDIPGDGYGDYLDLDVRGGVIQGWSEKACREGLAKIFGKRDTDEG